LIAVVESVSSDKLACSVILFSACISFCKFLLYKPKKEVIILYSNLITIKQKIFHDLYCSGFGNDSRYAQQEYIEEMPSDDLILSIEAELGFKFPTSYLALMKMHNGGIPNNRYLPIQEND
jgi:hypothetical protein